VGFARASVIEEDHGARTYETSRSKMGFSSDENKIIYTLSLASNALSFFGSGFI
jgi:hypothetical protein